MTYKPAVFNERGRRVVARGWRERVKERKDESESCEREKVERE